VCGGDYNAPPLNTSFSLMDWEQVVVSKMGVALNKTGRPIWYQYVHPSLHHTTFDRCGVPIFLGGMGRFDVGLFSCSLVQLHYCSMLFLSFCRYGSPYTWNKHGGMYGAGPIRWITENATLGGVNSFRSGFDMSDSWGNVGEQISGVVRWDEALPSSCAGACPWPDADCLEIGNNITQITVIESQSYFSWYAIANAPLLMSTRIDTLDPRLVAILQQPEVIAINQDYAGRRGMPVTPPLATNTGVVWAKPLTSAATVANIANTSDHGPSGAAAFLLNSGNTPNVTLWFKDIGFEHTTAALVRDVVQRKDLGVFIGSISVSLQPSESRMFKVVPKV
jgi:hypothetical protein